MHEHYRLLVSLVADGEATDAERAELAEHIAECDECAALLEAYGAVSAELGETEPPAKLAEGTMYRIKYVKRKPRFAFGRFTAVAAAAVVIVVAGFAFFSGQKDAIAPEAPAAVEGAPAEAPDTAESTIFYTSVAREDTDSAKEPSAAYESADMPETAPQAAPAPAGFGIVSDSARYDELSALAAVRDDIAAICVTSGEVPAGGASAVLNSMSGGVWYEAPASEMDSQEFDSIIYLNSGAEKCIIAVYYD